MFPFQLVGDPRASDSGCSSVLRPAGRGGDDVARHDPRSRRVAGGVLAIEIEDARVGRARDRAPGEQHLRPAAGVLVDRLTRVVELGHRQREPAERVLVDGRDRERAVQVVAHLRQCLARVRLGPDPVRDDRLRVRPGYERRRHRRQDDEHQRHRHDELDQREAGLGPQAVRTLSVRRRTTPRSSAAAHVTLEHATGTGTFRPNPETKPAKRVIRRVSCRPLLWK